MRYSWEVILGERKHRQDIALIQQRESKLKVAVDQQQIKLTGDTPL